MEKTDNGDYKSWGQILELSCATELGGTMVMKTKDINQDFKHSCGRILKLSCGFSANLQYSFREPSHEDRISMLPDEILLLILSFLTTEDASKTSVLSTRWMTLWMHSPRLHFTCPIPFDVRKIVFQRSIAEEELANRETRKLVLRVNRVLQLHQAPSLDEFIVCFDLNSDFQNEIDKWIQYAFSKRVRRLELEFTNMLPKHTRLPLKRQECSDLIYDLGAYGLRGCGGAKFCTMHLNSSIYINSFKELYLKSLDVTDKVIELLLLKCTFLERLTVIGAYSLRNVVVSGPSLMLKYLDITFPFQVESVTISCPNLKTLKLSQRGKLFLTNIPMLTELHVYGICIRPLQYLFSELSCCLSRLEVLMLHTEKPEHIIYRPEYPQLSKLKELVINIGAWDDRSLIELTSFIAACPNLHKFVLQLFWMDPSRIKRELEKRAVTGCLKCLKVVKVLGYYGRSCEDELIMYFIENAIALEKIIVDPQSNTSFIGAPHVRDVDEEKAARICSQQQLAKLVPKHIELIIL